MATLKELYTTLKSLRDMNLPVDAKLEKAADELEEQIIKEQILPSLSENIEPLLSEIQRDLVLVVEYHPGDPISVALSRKAKISDFSDAKQMTEPTSQPVSGGSKKDDKTNIKPSKVVKNPTKGLKVTFRDGTVIHENTAINTLIKCIKKIGYERVASLNFMYKGYNLVSKEMIPIIEGRVMQHKVDGYYIYSNTPNTDKRDKLQRISEAFGLGLKIEDGDLKKQY